MHHKYGHQDEMIALRLRLNWVKLLGQSARFLSNRNIDWLKMWRVYESINVSKLYHTHVCYTKSNSFRFSWNNLGQYDKTMTNPKLLTSAECANWKKYSNWIFNQMDVTSNMQRRKKCNTRAHPAITKSSHTKIWA